MSQSCGCAAVPTSLVCSCFGEHCVHWFASITSSQPGRCFHGSRLAHLVTARGLRCIEAANKHACAVFPPRLPFPSRHPHRVPRPLGCLRIYLPTLLILTLTRHAQSPHKPPMQAFSSSSSGATSAAAVLGRSDSSDDSLTFDLDWRPNLRCVKAVDELWKERVCDASDHSLAFLCG